MKEQIQFIMAHGEKVMTPTEEREAFRALNSAKQKVRSLEKLVWRSRSEAKQLGWARQRLKEARELIIQSNFGLVISRIKLTRARNVSFDVLVSEGLLILTRCVDKFKVTRGRKFSTYVCASLDNGFMRLGIVEGRQASRYFSDHETAMGEKDSVETHTHKSEGLMDLEECLKHNKAELTKDELTVIRNRFGIGCPEQTLDVLSQELNYSKERIRQIQVRALAKLREILDNSGEGESK